MQPRTLGCYPELKIKWTFARSRSGKNGKKTTNLKQIILHTMKEKTVTNVIILEQKVEQHRNLRNLKKLRKANKKQDN